MMMAVRPDLVAEEQYPPGEIQYHAGHLPILIGGRCLYVAQYRRPVGLRRKQGGGLDAGQGEALFDAVSTALAEKRAMQSFGLPWTSETLS